MALRPDKRIELVFARTEAALSNLGFAAARAADAMHEFSFAASVAVGTDEAVRAQEIAEAGIARVAAKLMDGGIGG